MSIEAQHQYNDNSKDISFFNIPVIEEVTSISESIANNLNKVIEQDKFNKMPLFLNIKDGFIEALADKIVKNSQKTIVIGVAGESASGKTTLVNNTVKACLNENKKGIYSIISSDDYFHDTSKELKQAGSYEALFETGFSFDVPDAINLDLMKHHITKLAKKDSIYSPLYDFVTCESKEQGVLKTPSKVILTEGLFVLTPKLRDILDIAIYVHTPHEYIKERWFIRAESRGKTGKAAQMQFDNVNREAQTHIRPTMNSADIIVNGLTSQEYIEFISDEIFKAVSSAIKID